MNPWQAVEDFEAALRAYTGAPYAVALSSASAALLLCLLWFKTRILNGADVEIPARTYVSVPAAVKLAGYRVKWSHDHWRGAYQLKPFPIWDCALRFTGGMYERGAFQCVSFAAAKILGIEQGGAILHDNRDADLWFRKMRFDGRTPGAEVDQDIIDVVGYHFPMLPSTAAALTLRLHHLPRNNDDQVRDYPDLSRKVAFL